MFAIDKYVLDEALRDSKNRGCEVCEYYPDINGCLELRYLSGEGNYVMLHRQLIHGVILLDDKIIMLMSQEKNRGFKSKSKRL